MTSARLELAMRCFRSHIANNKRNIYLSHLFGRRPIFPQGAIYREALLRTFDQSALKALHAGPDIRILITRPSSSLPGYLGVFAGLAMCGLRGLEKRKFYARLAAQVGFSKEFVSVKKCRTPAELADLILASSCTPPVTPLYTFNGRTALDGGLLEKIPISGLPQEPRVTLILLTTRGRKLDHRPGFIYSEPSEQLRVASWDYAHPGRVDSLYALGKKDGHSFIESMGAKRLGSNWENS
jgi:hypothetical protein